MLVTILWGYCVDDLEAWNWKWYAVNLLQTDTGVADDIGKVEFVIPTFSGIILEPISESASQLELEFGNSSREKGSYYFFQLFKN